MLEQEAADCRQRRINRLHRESKLPADKTWETFKHDWVSIALRQQLDQLGHFISAAYTAKRDPALHCQSRKLDNFDFLLLNDLGYLPPGSEESEVLFALIAERYERRSLGIRSNLVFSEWERIFANPMATAAAIDRVVHHSVILEFDVPSYRTNAAQQRGLAEEVNRQN